MKRLQFCLAVFAVLALTFSAFAQVQNGQFSGTVTDPTGAAVPNAKVTANNPATNLTVSATTNPTGSYTLKELPIGNYKLAAEAVGVEPGSDTSLCQPLALVGAVAGNVTLNRANGRVEVSSVVHCAET